MAVEAFQVDAEVTVESAQVGRQIEVQPVSTGHLVAVVDQDREVKAELVAQRVGKFGVFGTDRQQDPAMGPDRVVYRLQS